MNINQEHGKMKKLEENDKTCSKMMKRENEEMWLHTQNPRRFPGFKLFKVFHQDRVQQPRLVLVFKELSQERVRQRSLVVLFKALTTVSFFLRLALKQKEEEERVKRERERTGRTQEGAREVTKRKRDKRREKKVPKSSSRSSDARAAHTWQSGHCFHDPRPRSP